MRVACDMRAVLTGSAAPRKRDLALCMSARYQAGNRGKKGLIRFMTRKFFGTDGIRGRTNQMPMTAEMALKVGQAAGAHFLRGAHRHRVVIGKDTRLSGYMMETALSPASPASAWTW